jgi:hypothetical protein
LRQDCEDFFDHRRRLRSARQSGGEGRPATDPRRGLGWKHPDFVTCGTGGHLVHDVVLLLCLYWQNRGRTRRFIARTREGVHGGQLDLGIIRARSGCWVRGCVSARDVRRAFEALCGEARLRFGRDIQSPKDVA